MSSSHFSQGLLLAAQRSFHNNLPGALCAIQRHDSCSTALRTSTGSMPFHGQPKRKQVVDERRVSPPPSKRRVQSMTTQDAVSNFFTPTSQKGPEKTQWSILGNSLLIAHYWPSEDCEADRRQHKRRRIAAFDFDSTIITSASGRKFAADATDWKWWHASVPGTLKRLDDEGYQIAILSNQGGIDIPNDPKTIKMAQKRLADFKSKAAAVLGQLDLPISLYAATERDRYRKPRTGMWEELIEYYRLDGPDSVDATKSLFVGDAGGRLPNRVTRRAADFSCSDRNFAANVGIEFQTPEEFFLGEDAQPFRRTFDPGIHLIVTPAEPTQISATFSKKNDVDLVLLCGSPASGKSTFYWTYLAPLGYERVNQDILKSRDKCVAVARDLLSKGKSVAVDNTNADRETRAHWVKLAAQFRVPIRCVVLTTDPGICEHNDVVRALNGPLMNPENRSMLPKLAFTAFAARFSQPEVKEGFQDITVVDFKFSGSTAQQYIWKKYWV